MSEGDASVGGYKSRMDSKSRFCLQNALPAHIGYIGNHMKRNWRCEQGKLRTARAVRGGRETEHQLYMIEGEPPVRLPDLKPAEGETKYETSDHKTEHETRKRNHMMKWKTSGRKQGRIGVSIAREGWTITVSLLVANRPTTATDGANPLM